jgi:hypothetical protein
VLYAPLSAIVLTVVAFTAVGAPVLVMATAWLIALAEEAATLTLIATRIGTQGFTGGSRIGLRMPGPFGREIREVQPSDAFVPRSTTALDHHAQKIERVQTADGRDTLSGSLAISFVPGQARGAIHVAFCPPFVLVPRLDYRQVAGPVAGIKVGQLLPHGARFDVKLDRPAEAALQIMLEVKATSENGADDEKGPDAQARI